MIALLLAQTVHEPMSEWWYIIVAAMASATFVVALLVWNMVRPRGSIRVVDFSDLTIKDISLFSVALGMDLLPVVTAVAVEGEDEIISPSSEDEIISGDEYGSEDEYGALIQVAGAARMWRVADTQWGRNEGSRESLEMSINTLWEALIDLDRVQGGETLGDPQPAG